MLAPDNSETEDVVTVAANLSKVHSLKATIFHTMAYKFSLKINKNKLTPKTPIAFLKVLYNVAQKEKEKNQLRAVLSNSFSWPKDRYLGNYIKCCFCFKFLFHIKGSIFSHRHTRSNDCFQQHLPRFWVYSNS